LVIFRFSDLGVLKMSAIKKWLHLIIF